MNTIEYGQGAVNNTIGWGQGAKVGSSFSNLNSFSFDGIDDFFSGDTTYTQLNTSQHFTISFWIKYVGGGSPCGS